MATLVKVGEVLTAGFAKTGERKDGSGSWEMIVVKDSGKGKRDITIWVTNAPSGVVKDGTFTVESIESVKWGARKDNNDSWRDDVSINATVKANAIPDAASIFSDLDGDDDGELPF